MRLLAFAIFVVPYQRLAADTKSFSFLYYVAAVSVNSFDNGDSTSSSVRLARTLQSSNLARNTSILWLYAPEKRICHLRTIWPISLEWYNANLERFADMPGAV